MTAQAIANAIEAAVLRAGLGYSAWTIGVTDDPSRRYTEHGSPVAWMQWWADSEEHARAVESHFLAKGMKGGSGGLGHASYVYIF